MNPSIALDQFSKQLSRNKYNDVDKEFDFEAHKQTILWAVRSLGYGSKELYKSTATEDKLALYQFVSGLIDKITPNQLMEIFPITKEYDGHKYEVKDYFYAMDKCKEHGLDKPIGNSFEFLWDYYNKEIGGFVVYFLSTLSDVTKDKIGQGLMETYLAEIGSTTYAERVINGKRVLVENLVFNSKGKLV